MRITTEAFLGRRAISGYFFVKNVLQYLRPLTASCTRAVGGHSIAPVNCAMKINPDSDVAPSAVRI